MRSEEIYRKLIDRCFIDFDTGEIFPIKPKGIYFCKTSKRWIVRENRQYRGRFQDLSDAIELMDSLDINDIYLDTDAGHGYREVNTIQGSIKSHRLIFFAYHDYLPEFIDHINGRRDDNSIHNLRECTKSQNAMNQKRGRKSKSGTIGVRKISNLFEARIGFNGERLSLGLFRCPVEAIVARRLAEIEHFGEYRRQ